ncbi:MAG: alpha/beta fold hydrolase [Phycisphaerales bacterium]|nr:alpha/beta fold hydrolase [Phycisphaerales bacterium]
MIERFARLPAALARCTRTMRLGSTGVPAMLVHPDWRTPTPTMLWLHGRTVSKELDSGRYLRWLRHGIATCAIDLFGHGERLDETYHPPERILEVIQHTLGEINDIIGAITELEGGVFDHTRLGIGGISAGGMIALARCCEPHPFRCVTVEASSGDWDFQRGKSQVSDALIDKLNPTNHLERWMPIPLLALHCERDQWIPEQAMADFIEALRRICTDPTRIEYITYDRTGAPYEHAGFGRRTADARRRQLNFLERRLIPPGS